MASRLTAAMEEAYAAAPSHVVFLHTIELQHPDWAAPERFVVGDEGADDGNGGSGPVLLTLETGSTVPFTPTAFDISPPGFDDDGPTEGKITVDGVSSELIPLLEDAATSAGTISVTYRNYRSDARFEPGEVITGLKIKSVQVTATRVEGSLGFDDVGAQAFPRATYDIDNYPALYIAQNG